MIEFQKTICQDLDAGLEREWLETNGIGGFASSTLAGINTRRYHGLLTAALRPPSGRYLLLSKLEETLLSGGAQYELSANLYPGIVHPRGFRFLDRFRLGPFPIFTYAAGGVEIEKRVFMVHGENTTVIEYEVLSDVPCTLEVRPLIAFRDYHSTTHANGALNPAIDVRDGDVSIAPYEGLPRLHFFHNADRVSPEGNWYHNFEYPRERERGLDSTEDLFQPLVLRFEIPARGTAVIIVSTDMVSTDMHRAADAEGMRLRETARRDPFRTELAGAADQFIVRRGPDLHTVIAGYHWFSDWGRDTMIALPGLTLATGRFDIAREILLAFSAAADQGMLPNRFPDSGETPEYNTVDASLWYFEAIRQFLKYSGDGAFVRDRLYPTMKSIIDWHLRGTRYGIHCDSDGLISAGGGDTQLTWMDARVDGVPVTSRSGKAVEIQALWYNALLFSESLFPEDRLAGVAIRTRESFNAQFWNEPAGCLYDVVDGERRDASIRPNQVIALSLGYTMVAPERARRILEVVKNQLLTDFGLRTLAPSDPAYRGHCAGDQAARDSSYHQGTVWPWLLGPYLRACEKFQVETAHCHTNLKNHLKVAGLGSISEIFDGDKPHTPRGCIAQAWSVAEVLLCYT